MGMEWISPRQISQITTVSEALRLGGSFGLQKGIFISSGLLVLLSGLYMVFSRWGWNPWVILGLILWFALAIFGNIVIGKKIMGVIKPLKETDGPLSSDSLNIIRDPLDISH